jgi:hypothetical protein
MSRANGPMLPRSLGVWMIGFELQSKTGQGEEP